MESTNGVGLSIGPVMTLALNQVPKPLHAHGSAISNTINQVSGAIGPALYTSIMTMASQHFIQQSNETNKTLLQIKSMTSGSIPSIMQPSLSPSFRSCSLLR